MHSEKLNVSNYFYWNQFLASIQKPSIKNPLTSKLISRFIIKRWYSSQIKVAFYKWRSNIFHKHSTIKGWVNKEHNEDNRNHWELIEKKIGKSAEFIQKIYNSYFSKSNALNLLKLFKSWRHIIYHDKYLRQNYTKLKLHTNHIKLYNWMSKWRSRVHLTKSVRQKIINFQNSRKFELKTSLFNSLKMLTKNTKIAWRNIVGILEHFQVKESRYWFQKLQWFNKIQIINTLSSKIWGIKKIEAIFKFASKRAKSLAIYQLTQTTLFEKNKKQKLKSIINRKTTNELKWYYLKWIYFVTIKWFANEEEQYGATMINKFILDNDFNNLAIISKQKVIFILL